MKLHSFYSTAISHLELSALETVETIKPKIFLWMLIFTLNIIKNHIKARCEDVSGKFSNCEERKTENIMNCEE